MPQLVFETVTDVEKVRKPLLSASSFILWDT